MKPVLEPGVYWDSDFPTLMSWFIKKTTQGSMYGSLEECHVPSQQRRVGKVQFLLFNSPPKQTWGRWWERAIDSKKTLYSLFWNSDLNIFFFQADDHLVCADGHWPWPMSVRLRH